jgi:hypothetical protein
VGEVARLTAGARDPVAVRVDQCIGGNERSSPGQITSSQCNMRWSKLFGVAVSATLDIYARNLERTPKGHFLFTPIGQRIHAKIVMPGRQVHTSFHKLIGFLAATQFIVGKVDASSDLPCSVNSAYSKVRLFIRYCATEDGDHLALLLPGCLWRPCVTVVLRHRRIA